MELTVFVSAATLIVGALSSAVIWLFFETKRVEKEYKQELQLVYTKHYKCEQEQAALRERFASIEALYQQSQLYGMFPGSEAQMVIEAESGKIVEWTPAMTILTHWSQREVLGKSMTFLIPERFRSDHNAGVAKILVTKRAPERGPHNRVMNTKEGKEIAVYMEYSAWIANNCLMLSALIRVSRGEQQCESS